MLEVGSECKNVKLKRTNAKDMFLRLEMHVEYII